MPLIAETGLSHHSPFVRIKTHRTTASWPRGQRLATWNGQVVRLGGSIENVAHSVMNIGRWIPDDDGGVNGATLDASAKYRPNLNVVGWHGVADNFKPRCSTEGTICISPYFS